MKRLLSLLDLDNKYLRWIVVFALILLLSWMIYTLFIANPYTTDAYVQGNWVKVSARVAGPVVKIFVRNNQPVKKGQALFEIDPTIYQLRVKKAEGELQTINQELAALKEAIHAAVATLVQKKALLRFAYLELLRFNKLSQEQAVPIEKMNKARADYDSLYAQMIKAQHEITRLKFQLGSLLHNGKKQAAEAALAMARKHLSYTKVYATANGTISNFYLRMGQYIKIGEPVFSLIEADHWWVQANYLEWELHRIKPGQFASVKISSYPLHTFAGKVTAIGPGISRGRVIAEQTALPQVAESINWLRLFSRFPVFIDIVDRDPKYPLRVGATAAVMIHVK